VRGAPRDAGAAHAGDDRLGKLLRLVPEPDFIAGLRGPEPLGGGAFGEVYKARKTSIGKAYAIKFLRIDDSVQRDAVERELEQVRLFAAIDHPNLVTIEDMGVVLAFRT
jgi:hypothetical protein